MKPSSNFTEIVEAILFVSSRPVSVKQITEAVEGLSTVMVRECVKKLNRDYEKTGRVFRIETIGDGYQMRTLVQYREWVVKSDESKTIKLSPAMMETLSIVAYKQPSTRAQIEQIRGVDCSYSLRTLLQKKLIKIVGREQVPGRPSLYGTSKLFLEVFGLKDMKSLPSLNELGMADNESTQMELPLNVEPEPETTPET
ncbi:MAG: SMC-Scp complex subunit ScpB [SAR324 cluster bacterium]|nr:SMC-Scp complex subunit ScpB [SAR324 cluster bacterium]